MTRIEVLEENSRRYQKLSPSQQETPIYLWCCGGNSFWQASFMNSLPCTLGKIKFQIQHVHRYYRIFSNFPLQKSSFRHTFNEVNDWAHGTNSTFVETILRCVQYKEIREGGGQRQSINIIKMMKPPNIFYDIERLMKMTTIKMLLSFKKTKIFLI